MATVNQSIKQSGNSPGLRLQTTIAKAVELQVDQCVKIITKGQSIVITPCEEKPLSLEDRLAQFDPLKHGAAVMVNDLWLGAEKW